MQTTTASTTSGAITGQRVGDINRFDAIPYAQPPIGDLRFRPPVAAYLPPEFDATRPAAVGPQLRSRLADAMGDFDAQQDESCLTLTVWTPGADAAARPVVVWFHGGAWQSGAGALPWYDGAALAKAGDLVVVGVNYRLAAPGWLFAPGETSNVGLLDCEQAVQWVVDNIHAFGGDPARITVMGQSAGAGIIGGLLAREPRFQRAILQSGPFGRGFRGAEYAARLTDAYFAALGVKTLDQARALPVSALLDAQRDPTVMETLKQENSSRSLFGPVLDGDTLPATMQDLLQAATGKVDVLIGATLNEMAAFPGWGTDEAGQAESERMFGAAPRQWAQMAENQGCRTWLYRFDHAPNPRYGACHCIELPFVFGTVSAFGNAGMLEGLTSENAERLTTEMQQAWISFIRDGSPGWAPAPVEHRFL